MFEEVVQGGYGKWHIPKSPIPKSFKTSWAKGDYSEIVDTYCNRIVSGTAKSISEVRAEEICGNCVHNLFKSKSKEEKIMLLSSNGRKGGL